MHAASGPPFRAEHVGSLLRPRRLKDVARTQRSDERARQSYQRVLHEEVQRIVRMQESLGLQAVTDGEFGRSSWFGFFFERLEGFRLAPSLFKFHDDEGGEHEWPTCYCSSPMRRNGPIAVDEFRRTAALTGRIVKANLPSPSALHFFRGDDCRDRGVYPDIGQWWDDVVAIYRAEVRALHAAGCRYLQLDEVPLAMLCDPAVRARVAAMRLDPQDLVRQYIDVVNRVIEPRLAGLTIGMHLCRGNFRSRWMAEGGYEPIAEALFNDLAIDAYFLEYDSERAGDFSPLRHVGGHRQVVLGLVTTKSPQLEDKDWLRAQIDAAARYVPLERLALSPQCGFASVAGGNLLDEEQQWRKLGLIVDVAAQVWR